MADIFISITLISIIFYFVIKYFKNNKFQLPPGPKCLPILGYSPFIGTEPFKTFKELSQKYGNVFSIRLGSTPVVVCNDYKSVKEYLNNSSLLYRPTHLFDFHPGDLGFVSTSGDEWLEQRRHSLRYLKDYGLHNVTWEENITAELEEFLSKLAERAGKPVDISDILSISTSNNILSLVIGRRIPEGNSQKYIVKDSTDAFAAAFGQAGLINFFPNLAKFLAKMGISSIAENYKKMDTLNKFLKEEINARKKMSDYQDDVLIDNYLKEMKNVKNRNLESYFSEYNLIGNMQAMIHGGSESTRTSLEWLFLAMATFPEIQVKVQEEVDRVLGSDGKCEFFDRKLLPYTYATIMEIGRWRTIVPLNVLHRASEDTMIGEFHIPKDTIIIGNLWALHNDPKYWDNPEVFEPKRFLLDDGSLNTKEPDSYLPFAAGRRVCPGKLVALKEIFTYFIEIVRKFEILPLEDHKPIITGIAGTTYHPQPQMLRYKLR